MARRSTPPARPERPQHTVEEKRQDVARLRRRIADLEAFDSTVATKRFSDPAVTALEKSIESTLASIFGDKTAEYYRYSGAISLDSGPISMSGPWDRGHRDEAAEARRYLTAGKTNSLALLNQAVQTLEEEIEFAPAPTAVADTSWSAGQSEFKRQSKVFVVHGHDDAAKHELARFLEQIELEAVILHEQPNQGRTIIEKFVECSDEVAFSVVIFTPDDLGGAQAAPMQNARARQNVVFELGYFVAKLGRGRVCLLRKDDVEIPSDLYGVIYTELDAHEGWKLALVKELKAAGLTFDANRVWG